MGLKKEGHESFARIKRGRVIPLERPDICSLGEKGCAYGKESQATSSRSREIKMKSKDFCTQSSVGIVNESRIFPRAPCRWGKVVRRLGVDSQLNVKLVRAGRRVGVFNSDGMHLPGTKTQYQKIFRRNKGFTKI